MWKPALNAAPPRWRQAVNVAVIFGLHFRWDFIPILSGSTACSVALRPSASAWNQGGRPLLGHLDASGAQPRRSLVHPPETGPPCAAVSGSRPRVPLCGSARDSWRTVDVRTGEPVYYEPYRCNVFCPNNPDYERASTTYALGLFNEAGMDGLMDDDFVFYPGSTLLLRTLPRAFSERMRTPPAGSNRHNVLGQYREP